MEARSWALEMLVMAMNGVGGLKVAGQVGYGGVEGVQEGGVVVCRSCWRDAAWLRRG